MATETGVAQAVYPEGGLSRDGRLRPPKLGLLDYMLKAFDPQGAARPRLRPGRRSTTTACWRTARLLLTAATRKRARKGQARRLRHHAALRGAHNICA